MKVTINKTFVNENGTSFLKGRVLDVAPAVADKLAADGVIEVAKKAKPKKKDEVVKDARES